MTHLTFYDSCYYRDIASVMSESATDTSDKTSETSDSSESESESGEESSNATPKAESHDEATVEQDAGATTIPATTIHEPPPPTIEVRDEKVVAVTASEMLEESSATLHREDEPDVASAVPLNVDVGLSSEASQLAEEKIEAPRSVDKVARVVGQAKSDIISKPEVETDASEVHHVYQKTVVRQMEVRTADEQYDEHE